ncbi:PEROXIDASE [Salix purpurea]|uniref:peroxidase n=1 Tax=Salix purpurea TaxID=77065 RepID=A0A9Q0TH84_SALPP|nr:PEROXIDASE [Salix purpurea]
MLTSIFGIENMRKLSFLVFILCILISVKNQNAEIKKSSSSSKTAVKWPYASWDSFPSVFLSPFTSMEDDDEVLWHSNRSLEYDFYRDSCPQAERIIRRVVHELHKVNSSVAPALLRLVFHDCFIEGCDASILLDAAIGIDSEKDSPPNKNLKGFDIVDKIKSEIEMVCPGVVSCADIVALAARDGVVQAGGPFYPLYTGRRDSVRSFRDVASSELPSPNGDLSETLSSFASRGFDERETVSLLGGHSIGVIHCKFFQDRLYNFSRTNKPDPSLNTGFLNLLRSRCNDSSSSMAASPSPSPSFKATPPALAPSTSFDGTKSPSAAPSLSCSGSPSSSSREAEMRGSPSSLSAPPPSLKGSISFPPSSLSAPPPSLKGSISFPPSSSTPSSAPFEDSLLSSPEEPGMNMAQEGPGVDFGTLYYRGLLRGKGILYADQQLMARIETGIWVRAYASDISLFHRDFSLAMMKLSNLGVLTGSKGQVRLHCSKVA